MIPTLSENKRNTIIEELKNIIWYLKIKS
jgi:hypothetical protein